MKALAAKITHHKLLAKEHYYHASNLVPKDGHEEVSALRGFQQHSHLHSPGGDPDHMEELPSEHVGKIKRTAKNTMFSRHDKITTKHNPEAATNTTEKLSRYHAAGRSHLRLGDFHARKTAALQKEYTQRFNHARYGV